MLYTDADIITYDDVLSIDSDVANVASNEGISVTGSNSFVRHAIEEAAQSLLANMQSFGFNFADTSRFFRYPFDGSDSSPKPRCTLGMVVVDADTTTFWSPLKRWVVFVALRSFYQLASNRKTEDRYQKKADQYHKDICGRYWPAVKANGLPVNFSPIACPGAVYELNQTPFTASSITGVSGGSASAAVWDTAVTWTRSSDNAESAPSATISTTLLDNQVLSVSLAGLTVPHNVTGWNVYGGSQNGPLFLQASVAIGTTSFTFTSSPSLSGVLVGRGQPSQQSLVFLNLLNRT